MPKPTNIRRRLMLDINDIENLLDLLEFNKNVFKAFEAGQITKTDVDWLFHELEVFCNLKSIVIKN